VAGFQLLLDPTAEGTGTQLDVSDGAVNNGVGYRLQTLSIDDPANKIVSADSIDTEGWAPSFPHGLGPASINVVNRVGGSSSSDLLTKINALREKLHKFNREGGTARIVFPSGDTLTFDVIACEPGGLEFTNGFVSRNRADTVGYRLICKPGGRGAEQSLGTFTETTLPVLQAVVSGIKGSLVANGRAVITATQGDQWTVFTGVQSRFYDSSAHAALFYEAESRTPLGGATVVTGSASPSGGGSNNVVRQATLTTAYQAMLSTHSSGGTSMQHVGSYELLARIYRPTSNTGTVSVYAEWGAGDFGTPTKNDVVTFPVGEYEGVWTLCSLGTVHIPQLATQRWEGRVVAKSTVTGDDLDIDWIGLCPTTAPGDIASAGKWSAIARLDAPTSFSARDEFDQSSGALTGKTAPVGGTWAVLTGSDADDFTISTSDHTVQRTAVSDTGTLAGGAFTGRAVGLNLNLAASLATMDFTSNLDTARRGLLVRVVDASNFLAVMVDPQGGTGLVSVSVTKSVAGTAIPVATVSNIPAGTPSFGLTPWHTLRVVVNNGLIYVWLGNQGATPTLILSKFDSDLAGTLANGDVYLYDEQFTATAATRKYDNFAAWSLAADAACFASRTLTIDHQSATRQNSGGTATAAVSDRAGRYLKFAPGAAEGRSNRFFLKGVRGQQVQTNVWYDPNIDDIAVDLFATPKGVVVPEP
jgi:hypothetical protein